MKKVISIIAAAALVSCSSAVICAGAAEQDTNVLVTISDGKGDAPVLVQKEVKQAVVKKSPLQRIHSAATDAV